MARDHLTLEECVILARKVDRWDFSSSLEDETMIQGIFTGRLYQLNLALERRPKSNCLTSIYSIRVRYCPEIIKLTLNGRGDDFEIRSSIPSANEGIELARFDGVRRLKKLYNDLSCMMSIMTPGQPIILRETNRTIQSEGFRYAEKFL